ncbi:uncharacterized protein LOC119312171 [Triticum dicoccoides]|uniref:uncharacterized protein LOC119312171 n=1 Tax=Triticum dicoccoides TaxID=85692 RepID=UPI001891195B|nr:uncharacterized protein LOC119312171 [Triticum dicoccoides]
MRLSHCETYCAAPLCYIPCLPKSKDAPPPAAADAVAAPPCPVEDKPPQVQKIEVVAPAAADKDEDDKEHEDGDKTAAAAAPLPKSNLKKANCGEDGVCAPKGNVKWLDLLGKDLTEVKEFEPSESGDSMDDEGISTCVCVIQ